MKFHCSERGRLRRRMKALGSADQEIGETEVLLERMPELDDSLTDTHLSMATVQWAYDWDFAAAVIEAMAAPILPAATYRS